jgi:hypothetical protein
MYNGLIHAFPNITTVSTDCRFCSFHPSFLLFCKDLYFKSLSLGASESDRSCLIAWGSSGIGLDLAEFGGFGFYCSNWPAARELSVLKDHRKSYRRPAI